MKHFLRSHRLSTVCEEARCPNRGECFSKPTAAFLILGSQCTRSYVFCSVTSGEPGSVNDQEPGEVAAAAAQLDLKYLSLAPEGEGVERLEAGATVEVIQGLRRVKGARMTYTPSDGAVAVQGDHVELVDGAQRVQGRSLIFYTGDDRILVDGREESRTETVLRRNPQKP